MARSSSALLASALGVALVLGSGVAPAAAVDDGLWYYSALRIDQAHAEGFTGKGVKIAVIDGYVNPDVPTLVGADLQVREPSFCRNAEDTAFLPATSDALGVVPSASHGTSVVSMILGSGAGYPGQAGVRGVAPDATVLYYSVPVRGEGNESTCRDFEGEEDPVVDAVAEAMEEALDAGADIISISVIMSSTMNFGLAIARAMREKVPVVGGMVNQTGFIDGQVSAAYLPAGANGAIGVQALDAQVEIQKTNGRPNSDEDTTVAAAGLGMMVQGADYSGDWQEQAISGGTSLATPIVASMLALVKQKYPAATGDQLIQSLIRNTSGEADREPEYDPQQLYGYGVANVTNMLQVDPTKYPDENPLIDFATDTGYPSLEMIFGSDGVEPAPTVPTLPDDGEGFSLLPLLVVGGVVGLLVLAGLIALVIVLVVRKGRTPPPPAIGPER